MSKRRTAIVFGTVLLDTGAVATWAWRERRHPSARPYVRRVFLNLPRPFLQRSDLLRLLAPTLGERVLEVGPGTGTTPSLWLAASNPEGRSTSSISGRRCSTKPCAGRPSAESTMWFQPRGTRSSFPIQTRRSMPHSWSPHSVRYLTKTRRCANYERHQGGRFGYLARFRAT
jgi:hypothetical protein